MASGLKQYFDRLFPRLTATRRAARSRRGSHRDVVAKGHAELNQRLAAVVGTRVVSGPFAGLQLTTMAFREHVGAALLGVYESELHPSLDRLLAHRYPQIIDVGSKYGYYAVGLCLRDPAATAVAFDVDPWARRATRDVARANGVTSLNVLGFASAAWLDARLQAGALVVSDCEGFERDLFPAMTTAAADSSTFVIEVHEAMAPGVTALLVRRFAPTHELTHVPTQMRPTLPPELRARLASFTEEEIAVLTDELRGSRQEWLIAVPRVGRGAGGGT